MKEVYLGADHAGFKLKESIKDYLVKNNISFKDLGAFEEIKDDDYPDYAADLAKNVVKNHTKGILFCGSGQGVCIAANKISGSRAVTVSNTQDAKLTREHNDANILCLSGTLKVKEAINIVSVWLSTPFSNLARHKRRIEKISALEK